MGVNGTIWMIIFWIIITGGSIWLLTTIFPNLEDRSESNNDPLAVLKQRYVRGELSKEAFETIRHDLEQA